MQHDIANLVSAHICGHQLGPGEVRTSFSPAGVAAVTESAILLEEGTAGRSQLSIMGRCGITPVGGS